MSTKLTSATIVATGALGLALFACTVSTSSDTNPDIDAGNQGTSGGTSGTSGGTSGTSGGTSGTDSGTDSGVTQCQGLTERSPKFEQNSIACQQCINTQCCTEQAACGAVTPTAQNLDCNGYDDCAFKEAPEGCGGDETCITDTCDLAGPEVSAAHKAMYECFNAKCKTECEL